MDLVENSWCCLRFFEGDPGGCLDSLKRDIDSAKAGISLEIFDQRISGLIHGGVDRLVNEILHCASPKSITASNLA